MKRDQLAAPDLERAFIGAAMLSTDVGSQRAARMIVSDRCFLSPMWRAAWQHIAKAWDNGDDADPVGIGAKVEGELGRDGAVGDILELLGDYAAMPYTLVPRARSLAEVALRRDVAELGHNVTLGAQSSADLDGVLSYLSHAVALLEDLTAGEETGDIEPVAKAVEAAAESAEPAGWATGIPGYDSWCQGVRAGEVHIVGGASGVGKTWLLVQAANAAADAGRRVAFVSLEMSKPEIYTRLVAGRMGFRAFRLLRPGQTWGQAEHDEYLAARLALVTSGIRLYTDQRSVSQIAAMVRSTGPDVLIVDYLQLLDWSEDSRSEYAALTENANALQRLAKRQSCALLAATQQSRESIRQPNGLVQGGMGSGRIDQIADLWVLMSPDPDASDCYELVCRKNRHGKTGDKVKMRMDPSVGRFV